MKIYQTCSSDTLRAGSLPVLLQLSTLEAQALAFLLPLSEDYPGIDSWYRRKVVPGLRNGTRHLLRIERDGVLAGIGIAKNEPDERKICTVRVSGALANRGIGVRIFDGLLKWLDDDRPHLTVSDHRLPLYEKIFDYYGFCLSSTRAGHYVPHATEFGYNEPLMSPIQGAPIGCSQTMLAGGLMALAPDRSSAAPRSTARGRTPR